MKKKIFISILFIVILFSIFFITSSFATTEVLDPTLYASNRDTVSLQEVLGIIIKIAKVVLVIGFIASVYGANKCFKNGKKRLAIVLIIVCVLLISAEWYMWELQPIMRPIPVAE